MVMDVLLKGPIGNLTETEGHLNGISIIGAAIAYGSEPLRTYDAV